MTWGQMRLNLLTTTPGVPLDLLDEWLNSRYTTILESTDWIGLKAHTTVQTIAAYQSGADTVTATVGSAVITGSGTTWIQLQATGHTFYIPGDAVVYTIETVMADTSILLDRPYEGKTGNAAGTVYSGCAYVVMEYIYALPTDCRSIVTVLDPRTSLPLQPFTKDALDATAGTRALVGYPTSWAEYDDTPEEPDVPNQLPVLHQIEFYPPPLEARGYTLEYLKIANYFDGRNLATSPLPFVSTAAIMAGVRADIAIWQEKPTQALAYQKLFEFELAKLLQVEHAQRRTKSAMRMAPRFTRHRLERVDRGDSPHGWAQPGGPT